MRFKIEFWSEKKRRLEARTFPKIVVWPWPTCLLLCTNPQIRVDKRRRSFERFHFPKIHWQIRCRQNYFDAISYAEMFVYLLFWWKNMHLWKNTAFLESMYSSPPQKSLKNKQILVLKCFVIVLIFILLIRFFYNCWMILLNQCHERIIFHIPWKSIVFFQ